MSIVDKVNWLYLVVAGGIIHLIIDWFAQNHWQATNKMKRRVRHHWSAISSNDPGIDGFHYEWSEYGPWWDRDLAAYVHSGLHFLPLLLIFPFWAALIIAVLHLIIDTRSPLEWWGKFTKQTRSTQKFLFLDDPLVAQEGMPLPADLVDVGMTVSFWRDQTAHIAVIALVALLCVL